MSSSTAKELAEARTKIALLESARDHWTQSAVAAEARVVELEAAVDSAEIENGLTSNGNLWRFWREKAETLAAENRRLRTSIPSRASPEMIAAAWQAWHARHGGKLGPGPGFVEAINAALKLWRDEKGLTHE